MTRASSIRCSLRGAEHGHRKGAIGFFILLAVGIAGAIYALIAYNLVIQLVVVVLIGGLILWLGKKIVRPD